MEVFLFIVICIVWFISGAASFIYWWTKAFDFTRNDVPIMVVGGVCGPLSFFIGWCVHGEPVCDRVLFKKREKSS